MRYPVVMHKDTNSDYGVTVPDLPGCFSAGETMDEALVQVVEAIECHIEGLLMDEELVPPPASLETHGAHPEFAGGIWALIDIDLSKLRGKSKRINITLPERVLRTMDHYANRHGTSHSGLIAEAAMEYIATHGGREG